MRIGIFGGSFDPPTLGHSVVVKIAQDELKLDKVIISPTAQNPHKHAACASADDRQAMCELNFPGCEVSNYELSCPAPSYTIDLMRHITAEYPQDELFYIVGSDTVSQLSRWKDIDQLFQLCQFFCVQRGSSPIKCEYYSRVLIAQAVNWRECSSTLARTELQDQGHSQHIDEVVWKYICERGLYGTK